MNAQNLVKKNAAVMVKDSEALEKVVSTIVALSKDESKQQQLKENISKLAVINADDTIAQDILKKITRKSD